MRSRAEPLRTVRSHAEPLVTMAGHKNPCYITLPQKSIIKPNTWVLHGNHEWPYGPMRPHAEPCGAITLCAEPWVSMKNYSYS